jgi:hypothetical protein
MKNTKFLFIAITAVLMAFSCKKDKIDPVDNPPTQNEEELITTMKLTFIDSSGIDPTKEFYFKDADGPGGNPPSQFDTIRIEPNKTYWVSLELFNESVSPAENITSEVLAEAIEHLFCFTSNMSGNLSIVRTDSDGTYEIGLASKWETTSASNGSVVIKLKHQPGIKNGSCDVGETDIELSFVVEIQ